jgi:FlaA1/EpsC-like NDP-sugar epimerase
MSLAKAISGDQPFRYVEIGPKPGEKLYEELVTDSEAPRTVIEGNTYVILPDTLDMMPNDIREGYAKYDGLPRLTAPLRSDSDLLSETDAASMLRAAGLLG